MHRPRSHRFIRGAALSLCVALASISVSANDRSARIRPLPFEEAKRIITECAPKVAPETMAAITNHESRWRPFTIAINGRVPEAWKGWQPKSERAAIVAARRLIAAGYDFDIGFAQINVRNLSNPILRDRGITLENIFDTCTNVRAAEAILTDCYARARKRYPGEDTTPALHASLSCYNTGDFTKGKHNGYVRKVYAARVKGDLR